MLATYLESKMLFRSPNTPTWSRISICYFYTGRASKYIAYKNYFGGAADRVVDGERNFMVFSLIRSCNSTNRQLYTLTCFIIK